MFLSCLNFQEEILLKLFFGIKLPREDRGGKKKAFDIHLKTDKKK